MMSTTAAAAAAAATEYYIAALRHMWNALYRARTWKQQSQHATCWYKKLARSNEDFSAAS